MKTANALLTGNEECLFCQVAQPDPLCGRCRMSGGYRGDEPFARNDHGIEGRILNRQEEESDIDGFLVQRIDLFAGLHFMNIDGQVR